jgi:uncharacterized repeat protein (TIGR01451 family)
MKRQFARFNSATVAAVCVGLFLIAGIQIGAAGTQVVHGHVPEMVTRFGLKPLGRFNGTNHLKLALSLPLRDKPGLTNLLNQLYDPASPNYHRFLTAPEFAARFGPTPADYQALVGFATSNNLTIRNTHPNRVLLDLEGSVADIEKALRVKMQVYQHPSNARTFYAPDSDPALDTDVPVLHVIGLDNSVLPFPKWKQKTPAQNATARGTGSGPAGNFQGYDFRDAYVPGVSLTGTGQSVALFELDGYYTTDVLAYEGQTGLPNVPLVNVLLDGFNGVPQSFGGDGEVTLDIDMAIAMAPGISAVYVYEGFIPEDILNRIATDNTSRQISCSWGWLPFDPTTDQTFQQFASQGQSFYSASGDDGAEPQASLIVPPSDDPYITQVGGTTLTTTGPLGTWVSETVWSWFSIGFPAASSGGSSFTYPLPTWQQGINMSQNGGSTSFRNYPDVALTADNIYIIADNGIPQPGTGGTSCAAPLWAGLTALANEQAAINGDPPIGFLNPTIYALAKSTNYLHVLHDITTGNDTNDVSPTLYFAFPGYDLCTGWGTPNGSNLLNALAPVSSAPVLSVLTNVIFGGNGNGVVDFDECNDLTIILTNYGAVPATGVSATITSTTAGAIVAQGTASYPPIPAHGSGANLTTFTLSTEPSFVCGTPVKLTMVIKSDQVVQTNFLTLPSGVLGIPDSFTNSTQVVIPNTNSVPINSPILVSGLQSAGKVTVSVYLTAVADGGISLNLIGPNGTNVLLSQFNGGTGGNFGTGCSLSSETTFDDAASTPITSGLPPYVGSFSPQQPLSIFNLVNGTNLNGIWTLQVLDQFPGDTATLGCWSVNISPEVCSDGGGQCPGADLGLTMSASPNPVIVTSNLVYTLTVTNFGPGPADNVVIAQGLPTNLTFVQVSGYPSTPTLAGTNLNILLGSIPVYGTATVFVTAFPTSPGVITSSAIVGSQDTDNNPNNNTASASVICTEPTADVAVRMTGSPSSVLQGGILTYTINVTNNGPFTAKGVTLTTSLPTNANLISATTTQGTISFGGGFESIGDIGRGTNVVITIVVSPTVTGNITANTIASISPSEVDPNTFNNVAFVNTTVGPAADLGVTAVASPSPVVGGSNVTYIATITNLGPNTASSISFAQSLPAGTTFVSCSLAGSALNGNAIAGSIASLSAGGSVLVTDVITSPTLLPGVQSQPLVTTFSVFGQPGDPNTNNNVYTLQTLAEPPIVSVVSAGANVLSGSSNGSIGPSGRYTVQLYLQNVGTIPTTNLVATLLSTNGVTLPTGPQTYGVLAPGAAATAGQFSFTARSTNGGTINATLQLQDGANNLGNVTYNFVMPVVASFWNTNLISIPTQGDIPQPDSGPANPYPSAIVVSSVVGNVGSVTVTISNLYHTYPNDIGMLLVGPTGASAVLMSSVAEYSTMPSAATITFDPNASLLLPSSGQIVSGSYQPADYFAQEYPGITETFSNSPVPAGPYNTNLAVFGTISPNGTWRLYVEDNANGDAGAISNGWGLAITTITPVSQVADLAVAITALTNQLILGNNATYIWTVTNNGPNTATVFVTNILSSGLSYVTNLLPPGVSVVQTGSTNVFNIGSLAAGAGVAVTSLVATSANGAQTNTISAGSALLDGNPGNNSASSVVTVNPPLSDLAVLAISAAPNPVVLNSSVVYTLVVTNNGPSNAFNVVGWFTNTSAMQVSSAVPSQGVCLTNGSFIQCVLGTVPANSIAVVTVTATAASIGVVTNFWSVTTSCNDTNLINNTTNAKVTVTLPRAILTNGPVTLVAQAAPPYNGALNSGQTNTLSFTLTNIGSGSTTNLVATLLTNGGIRPLTASNVYGAIAPNGSASGVFNLVGTGSPGATLTATLSLRDGSNTNFSAVAYNFMVPLTKSYTNSAPIVIPYVGPASPYPAQIQVSGLTNGASDLVIGQVTASLNGFAHSFPHDVEAVLVSPAGDELVLMEHTGGPYAVSNLTFNFADSASQYLSSNTLTSGTYLATEYPPFDVFPGLAPVPAASTNLGFLNGSDVNGLWSLYVYDDSSGNNGIIANGWTLGLTAVSPINPVARLLVSTLESPDPAIGGNYVTYQVTVENLGPGVANNVVLTDFTPAGTALAQSPVALTQGTYGINNGTVTCNLGPIPAGGSAVATVQIIAGARGTIVNTATATTSSTDLYLPDATSVTKTPVSGNQAPVLAATNISGTVQLTVDGYLGQSYAVQISSNLMTWTTVSTNSGVFTIIDNSTNAPVRFYRAVQIPQ